ncbi:hypothetical protein GBAR_LOCUS15038 [Geodia barretti]|uniref:Uncharacterized protein n=1 Tax=Geodia barretti TaxID=519541 RepID=A0AA35S9S4_GEOBA|nr:hypothetical protein GBAR_LOCUS15038 [Geodia barretti]
MEPDLGEKMLAESREQVKALFAEDPDLKAWAISYPGKGYSSRWAASSRHPPPSAKTYDVAVDDIWQGVDGLFTTPATLHNSHFWRTHLDALWFELGGVDDVPGRWEDRIGGAPLPPDSAVEEGGARVVYDADP